MVSSGLETFGCSRIAPSDAVVASDKAASVAPVRSAASVMRLRSAPELDITAMLWPRGKGRRARNSTASMASSNELKRMTPALPATASNASALPASEPVCASAAAREDLGRADLHRHDGFAVGAGAPRGFEKVHGVGHAFDVAEDDAQLRQGGEVVDEIGNPAAELTAAGGEISRLQPEIVDGAVDDRRHRAALHGDGHRSRHRLLQRLVGHGGEIGRAAGDAHAGRADHRDAGALDRLRATAQPRLRPSGSPPSPKPAA